MLRHSITPGVEQANRGELERWAGRVIEASALEEVFAAE